MRSPKKSFRFIFLFLVVFAGFAAWRIFGSNTNFTETKKSFYIKTGSNFNDVIEQLDEQQILKNPVSFKLIAQSFELFVDEEHPQTLSRIVSCYQIIFLAHSKKLLHHNQRFLFLEVEDQFYRLCF